MRRAFALIVALLAWPIAAQDRATFERWLREDRWPEALELAQRLDDVGALAAAEIRAGQLSRASGRLAGQRLSGGYARISRARLEAARGQVAAADRWAEAAVEAAPESGDVLYWAGDLVSDRALARAWLGRYLERSDGQPEFRTRHVRAALETLGRAAESGRARWVVEKAPDRFELPLVAVPGRAGGVAGWTLRARLGERRRRAALLLDSGTHGVTLVRRIAERGGLEAFNERELVDLSGEAQALRGALPRLELGGLVYRDAWVTAIDDELDATGRFVGLVGLSLFAPYRVTLDPKARRLRADASEPKAPLDGEPYWWFAGHPLVEVELGELGSALFVLDTGAATSVLSREFASRHGLEPEAVELRARTIGGERSLERVRDIAIAFGPRRWQGTLWVVPFAETSLAAGVEISGLLGLDVLGGGTITIDGPSQTIALEAR